MKFSNMIISLLVGVFLLFASGCSMLDSTGSNNEGKAISIGSGSSSSKGTGVDLEFAEGNPRLDLTKGETTNFAFVFKNYQRHSISNMKLRVSGYDTGYVSGFEKFQSDTGGTFTSEIPTANPSTGEASQINIATMPVIVDNFMGQIYNFNPRFDYCFEAKTSYLETVCIPEKDKSSCDLDYTNTKVSNGPIGVSIDKLIAAGDKIRVEFTASNNGGGNIVNECFNTEDFSNKFNNLDVTLGTKTGVCKHKGQEEFVISGGKSQFYCEFDRDQDTAFTSNVVVKFDYLYQQTEKLSIKVEDLNYGYSN